MPEVKLSRLPSTLETLDYPISREVAADELADFTVRHADGEANLGEVVAGLSSDHFTSPDDLQTEVYEFLPTEAVGERGQSEGEG